MYVLFSLLHGFLEVVSIYIPCMKAILKQQYRIKATTFKVIVETEEQVEVSFSRTWDPSLQGKLIPLNIDKRYLFCFSALARMH